MQTLNDTSVEKIQTSIDNSTVTFKDRRQELLRRCLKMLTSTSSMMPNLPVRELEGKRV